MQNQRIMQGEKKQKETILKHLKEKMVLTFRLFHFLLLSMHNIFIRRYNIYALLCLKLLTLH